MLDVIVTVSESTPRHYVNQCRRSVQVAAELAKYPVNVIEAPGVPGHIGRAMRGGLERSTADYVCWVDDDDVVLPNAFACLERHFAQRPAAICAREIRLLANGNWVAVQARHHMNAFRRDVAESVALTEFAAYPNVALMRAAERHADGVIDELSWVYIYRFRRSEGQRLRAAASMQERQALT